MTDTDELLAIERALTDAEMHQFLADVKDRWPRLDGAKVADVLEHTTSYDMFLDKTEPFFEGHGPELPDGAPVTAVLHLLIILGRELTPLNVAKELLRAGLMPKPARKLAWHAYSTPPMRAVTGYQATGEDLHYLVFAHPQGGAYQLTRYPRNGQHTEDIISAASYVAAMATLGEGRRFAERFEAGDDIPEIGWFHGPRKGVSTT